MLKEIGACLKVNGEAIYKTRPIKPYELGNVFLTRKADGTVYAIVLSSKDGEQMPGSVSLPVSLADGVKKITLVGGDGAALTIKPGEEGRMEAVVPVDTKPPCADAWVLKIETVRAG